MLAARESISEFIKSKVLSDLSGITLPEMKFSTRSNNQTPEFPNCLNLYFYDDDPIGQYNPAYRELVASLELLVQVEPGRELAADLKAFRVMHLVNQFMAIQSIGKMDYSVDPAVSMKSSISWRESYPVGWRSSADIDERYVHKTAMIVFRYFEEKIIA